MRELLRRRILPRLTEAEMVFRSGRSPEELAVLADIFAGDLEGEDAGAIDRAFVLHRRESMRFPTPAHILALLPRCRPVSNAPALPENSGQKTPGIGMLVLRAIRGDKEAQCKLESIKIGGCQ